jgi:hypothetical protein
MSAMSTNERTFRSTLRPLKIALFSRQGVHRGEYHDMAGPTTGSTLVFSIKSSGMPRAMGRVIVSGSTVSRTSSWHGQSSTSLLSFVFVFDTFESLFQTWMTR